MLGGLEKIDLMDNFRWRSKAQNLKSLEGKLTKASLLPMVIIQRDNWERDPDSSIEEIFNRLDHTAMAVRSSSTKEDIAGSSNAGRFTTHLNVNSKQLKGSIEDVFASYEGIDPSDEVFIQQMVEEIYFSGVAFSHDPSTGSKYRVIEYIEGGDSTIVTSGSSSTKTFVCHERQNESGVELNAVLECIEELERVFPETFLDIEFAFSRKDSKPVLLQVRPLEVGRQLLNDNDFVAVLDRVQKQISYMNAPHPFLHGSSTVFGVMPDWNPAEIIGIRPKPLSMSLYRDVLTDSIWAYQRSNYGYRNLRGHPLMLELAGQPFIDVRVSFNSFIPEDLPEDLASRLVDYYIKRLVDLPNNHDKVEFEIVFSCFTLGMDSRLESLKEAGFTEGETIMLKDSLRSLTNKIISPDDGLWRKDWEKIRLLVERQKLIDKSGINLLQRIHWLLEDCRRYGTLPFAGLARCGFIARQLLDSLEEVGIFTKKRSEDFLESVTTVNKKLISSYLNRNREDFLEEFGHLRPGTYEISSSRYDETPDLYFDFKNQDRSKNQPVKSFHLTADESRQIEKKLQEEGLEGDVETFMEFLRAGTELREESKFFFSKNISDLLVLVEEWGASLGFSREDMSYVTIDCVKQAITTSSDHRVILNEAVQRGREQHKTCQSVWLPSLITSTEEVKSFHVSDNEPNYVTQKSVIAPIAYVDTDFEFSDRIALVKGADPGYDWLFASGIVGLITAYGGVNSHMAIRAHELGMPAAVGVGERKLENLRHSSKVILDCGLKNIEIIE